FIRVVECHEGLVVQQLFELLKANLATTGYKLQKHISKAIARCSSAIHTALEKYNKLAPLQKPPRPVLEYSDMASYSWLGEFDLLKHSHTDTMHKPWSVPGNCEVANKYFKVVCAHEEINRLNMEICRLDAWVKYEDAAMKTAVEMATNPALAAKLRHRYTEQRKVNLLHCAHISAIYCLDGYSG
ncbi:hypothetical protein L208DRAFT_1023498, partial [Tricholoma matsutake]